MAVTLSVDYRAFTDKSHWIYIALIAVLVYVMFFGTVQMGARRWIPLKFFNLQPSEFAKVGVALVLAKFYGENRGAPQWTDLAIGGALTLVPLALIAKEPDLGTAVVLLPVFVAIAYLAGMRLRVLGIVFLALILAAPVAWMFVLRPYQKSRVTTFLDPSQDAKGAGYQQIQAAHHRRLGGDSPVRASERGRKASCGFSPLPTTISFSRCWPRNRDSPASSWRLACICS